MIYPNQYSLPLGRFIGVLLPTIPIVIFKQDAVLPPGKRLILFLRCFVGSTGLILSFYAFRHMPLADASVIVFSTPVFVSIFARLFLREPCSTFHVFTVSLTLVGVLLITRPPFIFGDFVPSLSDEQAALEPTDDYNIWGPIAAFSSTLFGANAYVALRALKGLHFSVIMTNFGAFALVYTLVICWWNGVLCLPACSVDRWLIVALGIFSFLGQILLTVSLQMEQAGFVAIARSADIVFAFIWQIIFFGESPNGYSVAGALLVVFSVALTAVKKWTLALPRESATRRRLRCLLIE